MDGAGRNYPPGDLRVSDADRDQALSELSQAFQVGRITADEFDQRSGQALAASTGKELIALVADLPLDHPPAARTTTLEQVQRVVFTRIAIGASAVTATVLAATSAANALIHGPSSEQLKLFREMAARQGLPVPPGVPANPGFDWAGTITPAAIVVLLVALIIYLRARLARACRP